MDIPEDTLRKLYIDEKKTAKEIGEKYGCTNVSILRQLKKYNITVRTVSEANKGKHFSQRTEFKKGHHYSLATEFKKGHIPWLKEHYRIDPDLSMSDNLAYVLGVFYGDGWSHYAGAGNYRIGLEATEPSFVNSFKDAVYQLGFTSLILYERQRKDRQKRMFSVYFNSKKFYDYFANPDFEKLKDEIIEKRSWILAFIRGFYESEGSIRKRYQNTIEIKMTNTNTKLLALVEKLVVSLGMGYYICSGKPKNPNYKFCHHIYIRGTSVEKRKFLEEINPVIKRCPR